MTLDLDTFLTALYTIVDDLYQEHCAPHKPTRRGKRPKLSDSEVLTLAIYAQWKRNSERFALYSILPILLVLGKGRVRHESCAPLAPVLNP